jgi:hypothetical protein
VHVPPEPEGVGLDLVGHGSHKERVPLGGHEGQQSAVHEHAGGGVGDGWGGGVGWAARYQQEAALHEPAMRLESPPPVRHQRLQRAPTHIGRVPTLNSSDSDFSGEDNEGGIEDPNGVRHLYRDQTWTKEKFSFDPPPIDFTGVGGSRGSIFHRMPTFMMLFQLFWPDTLLQKICTETNRYARTVDGEGNLPGGTRWRRLSVARLKAFIAISILIGLKRQPNKKTYWNQKGSFFHCPIISSVFSRDRFQAITKCLHLTNPNSYVRNRKEVGYMTKCCK